MTGSDWVPNSAQRAAAEHGRGPLRLQAGAGSGKTTTLVQRIKLLVAQGICKPAEVLMLTFTKKAAAEMRHRAQAVLGGAEQPRVDTYHAFAWSLVQEFGPHLGMPAEARLLTQGPARLFARLHFDRLGVHSLDLTRLDAAVAETLAFFSWHRHEGTFRRAPHELLAALSETDDPALIQELLGAYQAYRALLREHGAADFDDLIALAVELLEEHPDVRQQVRERYRYLLVDEYQDTDYLQGRLVRLLAGDEANLTIVGDPDQTIYSFRGAAMTNIMHFDQEFSGVRSIDMVTNYRSTPQIVAAANAVIQHNARRKAEPLVSAQADGPRPQLVEAPDWPTEARWLAAEAKRLHEDDGVPYGEMAVLVRKNGLKLALYAALAEAGVPAQVVGGLDLWANEETGRFIAYLQALADPADDAAVAVALAMPRYGLTDRAVGALARQRRRGETLLETAARGASPSGAHPDPRVAQFLAEFWPLYRAQFAEGTLAAMRGALQLHRSSLSPEAQATCEQLLPLAEALLAYPELFERLSGGGVGGLALFCRYLGALRDQGDGIDAADWEPEGDAVRLMTVHGAKGMEFPVVFLPRLTKNDFHPDEKGKWKSLFPLAWHHDSDFAANHAQMMQEEERRLFYVAVTRAKERLYLSWAPHDPARKRPLEPSGFLAEVGPACNAVSLTDAPAPERAPAFDVGAVVGPLVSDRPAAALVGAPDGTWGQGEGGAAWFAPAVEASTWGAAPLDVLSFSHLQTYQLCPYRFYLQFVLRLPGRPSPAAEEGLRVHAAIERYGARQAQGELLGLAELVTLAGGGLGVERSPQEGAAGALVPNADQSVQVSRAGEGMRTEAAPADSAIVTSRASAGAKAHMESPLVGVPTLPGWLDGSFDPDDDHLELEADLPAEGTTADLPVDGAADPVVAESGGLEGALQGFWESEYAQVAPLATEQEFHVRIGTAVIRGFIDRIHGRPDGTVEVVDFKTYNRLQTEAEVRAGLQLPLYIHACRQALGYPDVGQGALAFLKHGQVVRVRYTEEELAYRLQQAEALVAAIQAGDWAPAPGAVCRWCPYSEVCPVAQG